MNNKLIWSQLIHLSTNMWGEGPLDPDVDQTSAREFAFCDTLRFDRPTYEAVTEAMRAAGENAVVIDLGDAVVWPSHPELAVRGAWSPDALKAELVRLRDMGLEPLPKMNFSAAHHAWLKEYGRMLSTPRYYEVCADLIRDVCEIFGTPRLFHLGYEEEMFAAQRKHQLVTCRQHDLWWHDLAFLTKEVERHGSRAWVWCDAIWADRATFRRRMPTSVVQSSWYYFDDFSPARRKWDDEWIRTHEWRQERCALPAFLQMAEWGYDQIPCGSNIYRQDAFPELVRFIKENVAPDHLMGFIMAPWKMETPKHLEHELYATRKVAEAKRLYES